MADVSEEAKSTNILCSENKICKLPCKKQKPHSKSVFDDSKTSVLQLLDGGKEFAGGKKAVQSLSRGVDDCKSSFQSARGRDRGSISTSNTPGYKIVPRMPVNDTAGPPDQVKPKSKEAENIDNELINILKPYITSSEEKVVSILIKYKQRFDNFVVQNQLSQKHFYIIMQLLKKVCNCKTKLQEKSFILTSCCHYKFLEQFVNQIMVAKLEHTLLSNVVTFLETIVILLPYTALDKAASQLMACSTCVQGAKKLLKINVPEEIVNKFAELVTELVKMKKLRENTNVSRESFKERLQQQLPPDDFRNLSVEPTREEVMTTESPFLRPNLIDGRYKDVEHYLDVQFRLLREDFIRPLREGIAAYKDTGNTSNTSVRVYKDVRFISAKEKRMLWTNDDRAYWFPRSKNERGAKRRVPMYHGTEVNLNITQFNLLELLASKKLLHGCLLCFTKNNFETILFATVSNTNESKEGIFINFCGSVTEDIYNSTYVMFECDVFFEPYKHVLNVLRNMDTDNFPMAKYLVEMSQEEALPGYLNHQRGQKLITVEGVNESVKHFDVLDKEAWPTAEELGLNPSQLTAFQAGLTQELAVIQGPPGTGKTFLALKIAQTLIENKVSKNPIIVVCLTNHALDQFLLGILKYTNNLVRIGGQSKVEELKEYNLNKLRINESEWTDRLKINYLRNHIVYFENFLFDVKRNRDGIISFETLNSYGVVSYAARKSIRGHFFEWLTDETDYNVYKMGTAIYKDEFVRVLAAGGRRILNNNYDDDDDYYSDDNNYDDDDYYSDDDDYFGGDFFTTERVQQQEIINNYKKEHILIKFQKNLTLKIRELEVQMFEEHQNGNGNLVAQLSEQLDSTRDKLLYIQHQHATRKSASLEEARAWEDINLWELTYDERWKLYWHWIEQLERAVLENIDDCRQSIKQLDAGMNYWTDCGCYELKQKDVIGLTTTGMARLHDKLQMLEPEIVIVEEAAEVLESHIVASLGASCKHLILIGDHKQLRPTTSVYQLAKQFDFDVSLFERLVRGRGGCVTLGVQHRMSPCIASLVSPSIYPDLKNHESTEELEPVRGMPKRLFFLSHNHYEDKQESADSNSHSNNFEAKYVTELCRHIIQQGYTADKITLLTTYVGQMVAIKKKTRVDPMLCGVQVTVVDNFQGEENDIIILSLVRSNPENRVGFLATENRVCVALSRARNGLYIVGNMVCLAQASSVWRNIRSTLEKQLAIGPSLPIRCQNHLDNGITYVSCAEDFKRLSPLGGCSKPCEEKLGCGHPCYLTCHVFSHESVICHVQMEKHRTKCGHTVNVECHQNPDYKRCQHKCEIPMTCEHECKSTCHLSQEDHHKARYKCIQPCQKLHEKCGHACTKRCGEDCGPCAHLIEHTFNCGHSVNLKCETSSTLKYLETVELKLACSRKSTDSCSTKISIKCMIDAQKQLKCGHAINAKCGDNIDQLICPEQCTKMLKCGHKCKKKCYQQCEEYSSGFLHNLAERQTCKEKCDRLLKCGHKCKLACCGKEKCKPCKEMVEKVISECGHKVTIICSKEVKRENCLEKCERLLECGHPCKELCGVECECHDEETDIIVPGLCGHREKLLCFEARKGNGVSSSNANCEHPCDMQLLCGHTCTGTCGQCLHGRLHIPCLQQTTKKLICGHKYTGACSAPCAPCDQPCQYKCTHSNCEKKCGEPCLPCKKACPYHCKHEWCMKRCGDVCNVSPCTKPCQELLQCRHPCMGMCGDPCPPVCSICNPQLLQQLFTVGTPLAKQRVVQIPGCDHIVRNDQLDYEEQVGVPCCPVCDEPVFLQRLTQTTNQRLKTVHSAHQEQQQYVKKSQDVIVQTIKDITPVAATNNTFLSKIQKQLNKFKEERKEGTLDYDQQTYIAAKVLLNLVTVWKDDKNPNEYPLLSAQTKLLLDFVSQHLGMFGQQQVQDLRLEIQRLFRLSQLENLIRAIKQIKEDIENKEKLLEGKLPNDPEVKIYRLRNKQLRDTFLDHSKFELTFKNFKVGVLEDSFASFQQGRAAVELLKSMSFNIRCFYYSKFQTLLQEVEVHSIPDILDASCENRKLVLFRDFEKLVGNLI